MMIREKHIKNINEIDDNSKISSQIKVRVNIENLMAKLKKKERKDRNSSIIVTCALLAVLAVAGFLITD